MKKSFLFFSFFFLMIFAVAQEFDIRSLTADPNDLTLRQPANQKITRNGEQTALVKVTTNIKGMKFESTTAIGITDVVHRPDGYWVYVAPRERGIRLMADDYLAMDVNLPEPAQSLMVYNLVVAAKGAAPAIADVVKITFRINQSDVYIRTGNNAPVKSSGNNAVFNLPRGTHTFRFIKEGFREEEIQVEVDEEKIVDVNLAQGTSTTRFALSGWIIVTSEPSGAEVYLNDQRVGQTPYQGRNIAGNYNIMLRLPMYYDYTGQFELVEGATLNLPPIEMKPRFGYWQVTSTPDDAEVYLDDKYIGSTPLSRAQISSGNHTLKVRKTLYHEHSENFTIEDGDDKTFPVNLKAAFGELRITSDPSGANVFVDGRQVGITPYENKQQPSGVYNVKLTAALYSDANEQVVVSDGQKTEKFIPMTKNYGTLRVIAPGAEIFLNGQKVATGEYTANLTPGKYRVKATRNLHKDDEKEVFVLLGQTETVELSPVPRQGAVSIVSQPFDAHGAEIFINRQKRKETTPAVIPLLIGNYEVTLKKQGYLDLSKSIEIKEGKEEELVFNMQTFQGSMAQKARRHKTAKIIYGISALAAAGAGTYFALSANTLYGDYETAGTDASDIYNQMEQHRLYSFVAFGVAAPLAVLTIVKASQQRKAERKINIAALPVPDGMMVGLTWRF
ncbi:MAG TPA: PEGA domain-containing protein [Bacteroidales bacterium]|nr:PEGA domain-containing protein [Bacteroidales bacterium]